MKNLKTLLLATFVMLFVATTLSSCKKWTASRRIDGTWNASSYKEDGQELIGSSSLYSSIEFRFSKSDKESGDVTLTAVVNPGVPTYGGTTIVENGTYECKDKAEKLIVTFTGSSGTSIETYDMELSKDEMTLSGNISGYSVEIEADKE